MMEFVWIAIACQFIFGVVGMLCYMDWSTPPRPPKKKRDWEATGFKLGRLVRAAKN